MDGTCLQETRDAAVKLIQIILKFKEIKSNLIKVPFPRLGKVVRVCVICDHILQVIDFENAVISYANICICKGLLNDFSAVDNVTKYRVFESRRG